MRWKQSVTAISTVGAAVAVFCVGTVLTNSNDNTLIEAFMVFIYLVTSGLFATIGVQAKRMTHKPDVTEAMIEELHTGGKFEDPLSRVYLYPEEHSDQEFIYLRRLYASHNAA